AGLFLDRLGSACPLLQQAENLTGRKLSRRLNMAAAAQLLADGLQVSDHLRAPRAVRNDSVHFAEDVARSEVPLDQLPHSVRVLSEDQVGHSEGVEINQAAS